MDYVIQVNSKENTKFTMYKVCFLKNCMRKIIGDDGEIEVLCKHGIGHGKGVHTCDGCCENKNDYFVETQYSGALKSAWLFLAAESIGCVSCFLAVFFHVDRLRWGRFHRGQKLAVVHM